MFDSVAQLVEQYTFNVWALGSSPSGITESKENENEKQNDCFKLAFSFFIHAHFPTHSESHAIMVNKANTTYHPFRFLVSFLVIHAMPL